MRRAEQTTSQVLQEARRLVEAGWCQGPYWDEIDGQLCYCALGAVYAVLGIEWELAAEVPSAEKALDAAALALSNGDQPSAVGWNEDRRHTQADVLTLFDQALAAVTK